MGKDIAGPLLLVAVVVLGGAGVYFSRDASFLSNSDVAETQPAAVVTSGEDTIASSTPTDTLELQ